MKECPKCKKSKTLDSFGKSKNRKDGLQRACKPCKAEYDKKHYEKSPKQYFEKQRVYSKNKREYIWSFKDKCVDCGNDDKRVLDFDHVRGDKKFNLGDGIKHSYKKIDEEIKKCKVRCSNCHRIKTYEKNRRL
tara:strand:+ start:256 stop:654 length:399 start_codon:yes stop_codon:yes gene_type:complete